mmetsp:Transcript_27091/g.58758  ORF Transcript_27091/g.58758 Transcript_27091/m.58758 type:complete len:93 (-) Transcript_27091:296-574(-)
MEQATADAAIDLEQPAETDETTGVAGVRSKKVTWADVDSGSTSDSEVDQEMNEKYGKRSGRYGLRRRIVGVDDNMIAMSRMKRTCDSTMSSM